MLTSELYKALECPVCYDVCGTRIFLCLNGHSVCSECKARLVSCPQGACPYADPPTRNRTLEAIVQIILDAATLKQGNEICRFKCPRASTETQKSDCEERLVPCPGNDCQELIRLSDLLSHLEEEHPAVTISRAVAKDCASFRKPFLWTKAMLFNAGYASWHTRCDASPHGWVFLRGWVKRGQVALALIMMAARDVTLRFKCEMSLSCGGNELTFEPAPLYPVDVGEEDILADDDCLRIDRGTVARFLTEEGLTQEWREQRYSAVFWVTFRLIKDTY